MRLRASLLALFPAGVVGEELVELASAAPLHPDEAAYVASAVPKRVAEFRAGRHCAREALRRLGAPVEALASAERAPVWPESVVGAITHCEGFCAAVVARASSCAGLGFDAERAGSVTAELWERIACPAELARARPDEAWRTIAFSAKESLFKAQYALTHAWLGFEDASVEARAPGELALRLERAVAGLGERGAEIAGRYALEDALVFTSVALPPRV